MHDDAGKYRRQGRHTRGGPRPCSTAAEPIAASMVSTQGCPRRNEKAQIVRPDGTPIPRLFSAGELGSTYSYLYQQTGAIGEYLAFGRIAARNAMAEQPWD